MVTKEDISDLLAGLKEDNLAFFEYVMDLILRIQSETESIDNPPLKRFLEKERAKLNVRIKKLEKYSDESYQEMISEVEKLVKEINTSSSNNYFLEYKRNDLMILTQELEDANEEISEKNKALELQKIQIEKQAKELKNANAAILAKNKELRSQNEHIQDQADYLHEANKSISKMHAEVQKQKEEILRKNTELISLNNEKNNLIGIVAHDLKSPLNQIKGLISIIKLQPDKVDPEMMAYLDIIENSATRLSGMINKILDVEAIESKKPNIKIEKTDIGKLMKELVKNHEIVAQEKNITLNADIESGRLEAEVDKGYATQIYENLVSNAVKFSPRWSTVYIKLYRDKKRVVCEIKDEGPGISEDDQKKLFLKYQKLSAQPTGNETSTGLGLSIVKRYVEAMNGKIWCESELGKGASFFVAF